IPNKYLDTLVHTFFSSLHALGRRYDVAVYFIAGNSPVTWIPHLVGTKTILNVDGLDWKREKWPPLAKKYIQWAAYMATRLPTVCLADSRVVQAYYREQWGAEPVYIPYGSEVPILPPGETLARFGLEPRRYVLFVGRLVPENSVHHLVSAFRELETDLKCAIVGDASYAGDYIAGLKASAAGDPRIVFTGYVFGRGYHELGSNATLFVETSGVGGTHPALLEAMAFGNCVVVNDTPENLETIGDAGLGYDGQAGTASLRQVLARLLRDPEMVADYRSRASRRVQAHYTWEVVTDEYERLFFRVCGQPLPGRLREAGNG
ncbi:MAG: glycosyltransferase, partial [Chloroflexi bacterium]